MHHLPFPVLCATVDFLVLDKPAGISVHSDPAGQDMLSLLQQSQPRQAFFPVHRLDAATSGCLLVARSLASARILTAHFAKRRVYKSYHACVHGKPNPAEGEIFTHLSPETPGSQRMSVVEPGAGPPAFTTYRTLRSCPEFSLVELHPITGRTHQLRVHLRHLGHPILGDPLYAFPNTPSAARLMLHAATLIFPDADGHVHEIHAPRPF